MSLVERFRARQNLPTVLEFDFKTGDHVFKMEVSRFSQEELNAAEIESEKNAKDRGYQPNQLDSTTTMLIRGYCLAPYVLRHLKKWEHMPPEGEQKIEYSQGATKEIFCEMSASERTTLGVCYFEALAEAIKKNSQETSSEKVS